jgi:hypothetical protein
VNLTEGSLAGHVWLAGIGEDRDQDRRDASRSCVSGELSEFEFDTAGTVRDSLGEIVERRGSPSCESGDVGAVAVPTPPSVGERPLPSGSWTGSPRLAPEPDACHIGAHLLLVQRDELDHKVLVHVLTTLQNQRPRVLGTMWGITELQPRPERQ